MTCVSRDIFRAVAQEVSRTRGAEVNSHQTHKVIISFLSNVLQMAGVGSWFCVYVNMQMTTDKYDGSPSDWMLACRVLVAFAA